jgi:hypothetical protein
VAEASCRLKVAPTVRDAIQLYGFVCPVLQLLPFDSYLRVEIADTGLILETDRHFRRDSYQLSPKAGSAVFVDIETDYISSGGGSEGYSFHSGSMHKTMKQLEDEGFAGEIAKTALIACYSQRSPVMRTAFDNEIRWATDEGGGTVLSLLSSTEGGYRRLEKQLMQQFRMDSQPARKTRMRTGQGGGQ